MAYEIPMYRFRKGVPHEDAKRMVEAFNDFLKTAPGFKERRTYHDRDRDVWIDVVEWNSMEEALKGMEDFGKSPLCAKFLELVDPELNAMHHGDLVQVFTAPAPA